MSSVDRRNLARVITIGLIVGFVLLFAAGVIYKVNDRLIHVTESKPK